jgi:hypothetical protein
MTLLSRAAQRFLLVVCIFGFALTTVADAKTKKAGKRKIVKRPNMVQMRAISNSARLSAKQGLRVRDIRIQKRVDKVKAIVAQFLQAKTVKNFVEKAPKKLRVKRRFFLGKDFKKTLPYAVADGTRLHLFESPAMKSGVTLAFYEREDGREGLRLRGRDITPKKNESDRRWMKRVAKVLKAKTRKRRKKSKSAWLQLLEWMLPEATADEYEPAYMAALYAAYEVNSLTMKPSEFKAQYGISRRVFNDLQRYVQLDTGLMSEEEADAEIKTDRICFGGPTEDVDVSRARESGLAGVRNLPLPDDPEILKLLGLEKIADGDRNFIQVYPAALDSKELDFIITDEPVGDQSGSLESIPEALREFDPDQRAVPEDDRDQLGEDNRVISRTRIDFSGESPSYEYPFREATCQGDAVYSFSQIKEGATARSSCSAEGRADGFIKADRTFHACNVAMQNECRMPLFGINGRQNCWGGGSNGWSNNADTRACVRAIFDADGPVEGAAHYCDAPEGDNTDALNAHELNFKVQILNRLGTAEPDQVSVSRAVIIGSGENMSIRQVRAKDYETRNGRLTVGAVISALPNFGEVTAETYEEFIASIRDPYTEAQADLIENWINTLASEERQREAARLAQKAGENVNYVEGTNEDLFYQTRRDLLVMLAQQSPEIYGGFASGDDLQAGPIGDPVEITIDQAVDAMNDFIFTEAGVRRPAAGHSDLIKINDFCPPSEANCRGVLERLFEESSLNQSAVMQSNTWLDLTQGMLDEQPDCAQEEVPEADATVQEELQAVADSLGEQGTEGLVDPSQRLLSYVNAVTALCRSASFGRIFRQLAEDEDEEVEERLIREDTEGNRWVPYRPNEYYQKESR